LQYYVLCYSRSTGSLLDWFKSACTTDFCHQEAFLVAKNREFSRLDAATRWENAPLGFSVSLRVGRSEDVLRVKDKVAIITGSGSGIGRATAEVFSREGAKVVVADVEEETGEGTTRQILQEGGVAHFVKADVSKESEAQKIAEEAIAAFGRIDILVNNAATFVLKGFDASVEDLRRSCDVNIIGTVSATKFAAKHMKVNGGVIVNLGSISGVVAQAQLFAYSITKAAILQLTRNMAMDLSSYGIRVNCVCPGPVLTPALMKKHGSDLQKIDREEGRLTLFGRVAQPAEIAYAILFLACEESSYITGTSLMVDGGFTAQ
jgi:NAD(P)-dependent dehydrogenase (short-subunit alcohol dehydrogenase family)